MPLRLLENPRFLVVYSGVLTAVFALTVALGVGYLVTSPHSVAGAESKDWHHADFDQLTVHRLNIVEPDGTPRLVLASKAAYPGSMVHGKEIARPDRSDVAGMLMMNDEGSENGGFIFSGAKDKNGTLHSSGHLSFDEYEQDQTFALEMNQDGDRRTSGLRLFDNGKGFITTEAIDAVEAVKRMPTDTPARLEAARKAMQQVLAKYPIAETPRGYFGREPDKSSVLRLQDAAGRSRILLRVAADGTPSLQFLDATGKVMQQWPQGASR